MRVKVLFFGMVKDSVARREEQFAVAPGGALSTVFDHYAGQFPRLRDMAGSIVMARNQEFAGRSTDVADGDEVAFLPPVSGGLDLYTHEITDAQGNFYALTRQPIDSREIVDRLVRGEDGAVITFEGVVRNNTKGRPTLFLDYECYESMAIKMMAEIGRDIAGEFPIGRISMVHRLGRLQIGEASVVIVVAAPHRKAAFAASLEGINRLKRLVPIWKKEHVAHVEVSAAAEWAQGAPKATK